MVERSGPDLFGTEFVRIIGNHRAFVFAKQGAARKRMEFLSLASAIKNGLHAPNLLAYKAARKRGTMAGINSIEFLAPFFERLEASKVDFQRAACGQKKPYHHVVIITSKYLPVF